MSHFNFENTVAELTRLDAPLQSRPPTGWRRRAASNVEPGAEITEKNISSQDTESQVADEFDATAAELIPPSVAVVSGSPEKLSSTAKESESKTRSTKLLPSTIMSCSAIPNIMQLEESRETALCPGNRKADDKNGDISDSLLSGSDGSEYKGDDSESDDDSSYPSSTSSPKKKRSYSFWNEEWSRSIYACFRHYIEDVGTVERNRGRLPGFKEVRKFIRDHPEILPDKDEKTKIYRIKSKVFNDRKVAREKLRRLTNQKKSRSICMKQKTK